MVAFSWLARRAVSLARLGCLLLTYQVTYLRQAWSRGVLGGTPSHRILLFEKV